MREPKETGLGDGGGHLGSIRGGMERCVGLSPSKLRPKEKGVSPLWGGAAGLEGFLAEGPSGRAPCTWLPAHLSAPLGGEPGRERSRGRPVRGAEGEVGALGEWGRALRVGEQHGRRPGGEKVPAGVDSGSGGGVRAGGGWDAESGPSPSCSPLRGLRFRLSFLCPRGRAACQAGFIRLHLRASACCAQEGGTEGPRAARMPPEPHLPRASASQVNLSGSEPPPRPPGVMVLTLQMRKLRLRAPRHFPKAPQPLTCHGYESSFEPCLLLQEAFPN